MARTAPQPVVLDGLCNAWVEPDGTVHPVGWYGHSEFAAQRREFDYELEDRGWVRLSESEWMFQRFVTQPQFDVIFDWYLTNGHEDDWNPDDFPMRN